MDNLLRPLFFEFLLKPFLVLFVGVRVSGREHITGLKNFILAANHSSHLDTLVLMSLFKTSQINQVRPVAAADYFTRNRWIERLTRLFFNILPIERKNINAGNNPLETLLSSLASGETLILFPEGTRCQGPDLGEFHSGIAHLAEKRPDIPVVPVYLSNMGRALPKGEVFLVPFICEARIGPPLFLKGSKEEKIMHLKNEILKLKGQSPWA